MEFLRTCAAWVAVLTGIAAIMTAINSRAEACPQFLAQYCVVEKDGFRHTDWTNPCFAKERGARVLHLGACEGPICGKNLAPVCSVDPKTHRKKTYLNLCLSDVADAKLLHKGACRVIHH